MLSCQQLVELVTEYLEGTLEAPTLAELEEHLGICEGCEVYVAQVRTTIELLRTLRDETIPLEPPDDLLVAVRARADTP